jgi:hypothetical protein
MAFDLAAAKARARKIVHKAFGLAAEYAHPSLAAPVPLRVRWHYKDNKNGDLDNDGYSQIYDLIERVIFDRAELNQLGVTPEMGARITIKAPNFNNVVLALDQRMPSEGPLEEVWTVGKITDERFPP